MRTTTIPRFFILLLLLPASPAWLHAQGTAFTYQGRLTTNGTVAGGNYDFAFSIYSASSGGTLISEPLTNSSTPVAGGLFTVILDFGTDAFTGASNWLDISVRPTGAGGTFTELTSRQQLTPAPYAIFAENTSATGIAGIIPNYNLQAFQFPYNALGGGFGNISINGSATVAGGENNKATNSNSTVSGGANNTAGANASTVAGGSENTASTDHATVGGGQGNSAEGEDAVVAGGNGNTANNNSSSVGGGTGNTASGDHATVGGGQSNSSTGNHDVVAGGQSNTAGDQFTTVGGGYGNQSTVIYGTVAGGDANHAAGEASAIAGGVGNTANGTGAFIGAGGYDNVTTQGSTANGVCSVIGGGINNVIQTGGDHSVIGGGQNNQVTGSFATVPGGFANLASGSFSFAAGQQASATNQGAFVWSDSESGTFASTKTNQFNVRANGGVVFVTGGAGMTVDGQAVFAGTNGASLTSLNASQLSSGVVPAAVLPGFQASGNFDTIGGGTGNSISFGSNETIGGGINNNSSGSQGTVSGGKQNTNSAVYGVIGGGFGNIASDVITTVAGGENNHSTINGSAIGGGFGNLCSGADAAISGGNGNQAGAQGAFVGGGFDNSSTANYATIPGGLGNLASASNSFAAGYNARATNAGSFVWSDSSSATAFDSVSDNSFNIRANGGVWMSTSGAGLAVDGSLTLNNAGTTTIYGYDNQLMFYSDLSQNFYGGVGGNTATPGQQNVGLGYQALLEEQGGNYNTAIGDGALRSNLGGNQNTIIGCDAFFGVFNGFNNIGIGYAAGYQSTALTNCIYIGNEGGFGAENGIIRIGTDGTQTACYLAGSVYANGTFVSSSDRNAKENFKPVDAAAVLEKVAALPVTRWSYKQDAGIEHIGPMAQDFYAAFNVGPDDTHITTIDEGGVALAAVQGLNLKLEDQIKEQTSRMKEKDTEIDDLKQRLAVLETMVKSLADNK